MRWHLHSERILTREMAKRGGLLPKHAAASILADSLGISPEFASDLVRRLVRTQRLSTDASYILLNSHITCHCGARMFPAALARTGGLCPHCRRMVTT